MGRIVEMAFPWRVRNLATTLAVDGFPDVEFAYAR